MTKKIFLDMDGVIADFDTEFNNRHGMSPHQARIDTDASFWVKFNENPTDFYLNMPHYDNTFRLIKSVESLAMEHGYKVEILTAIPRMTTYATAIEEKKQWLIDRDLGHIPFNIGPHSADKHKHYRDGAILIDDNIYNIRQWKAKGGFGILFNNGVDSLRDMLDYLEHELQNEQRLATRKGF